MSRARLTAVLAGLLVPLLAAPAGAAAQSSSGIQFIGGTPISVRSVPVRFTGGVVVSFHGDAAGGCASRGLCGYAGTVSWQPPSTGSLEILTFRDHGHLSYQLELQPGNLSNLPEIGGVTTAKVQLSSSPPLAPTPVSSCLDAAQAGTVLSLPVRDGQALFTLAGAEPSLLGTRCAGPLDSDVMPEIPTGALALGAVLHGRTTVALVASHPFASGGFAGTVQSSLTMALGRPGPTTRTQPDNGQPGLPEIQVHYRATLSGSIVESVAGAADPLICAPLGSCGSAGTTTLTPRASGVRASFTVLGQPRTPYRDLLAAVGLTRGPSNRFILSSGAVTWDGGVIASHLAQGSTTCSDSAPLGQGQILLATSGGHLRAAYLSGLGGFTARTRCPSPGGSVTSSLASAAIPLRDMARRTITLSLTKGSALSDDGYDVRTVPRLTLTLTRLRVRHVGTAGSSGTVVGVNVSGPIGTSYAP